MNETYYIKISGKANIPKRLEIGHNYKVVIDASITQEQKIDNEDGNFDVIFKVEPITAEISKDNGEIIKAKDPRKNSVKVRNLLKRYWMDDNCGIDFEKVYTEVTNEHLNNLSTTFQIVKKRLQ